MACVRSASIFCWPRARTVFFLRELGRFPAEAACEPPVDWELLAAVGVCAFWVLAADLLAEGGPVEAAPAAVCGLACAAKAAAQVNKSAPTALNRKARVPVETLSVKAKSFPRLRSSTPGLRRKKKAQLDPGTVIIPHHHRRSMGYSASSNRATSGYGSVPARKAVPSCRVEPRCRTRNTTSWPLFMLDST